jgi:inner membrane protein
MLVYLVFATHVLLDSFTVYGTQIFWPFITTPMSWSTIFIIDPLYTLPLLMGLIAALIAGRRWSWGYTINTIGLTLSSGYLAWTLGAKMHVDNVVRKSIEDQNIAHVKVLTTPSPFNSLLWRVLAVDDTNYYEGFYSVLDKDKTIHFKHYQRSLDLVEPLSDSWAVQRLQWFTKNYYAASNVNDDIIITDLRMGTEPEYAFRFKVGEMANPHPKSAPVEQMPGIQNFERLYWVWARIWDSQAAYY